MQGGRAVGSSVRTWVLNYIKLLPYIGKFPCYRRFAWKKFMSKIFTLWAFHENLTHGGVWKRLVHSRRPHLSWNLGGSYWSSYTMMAGVLANFGPNSPTILLVWPTFPTRCGTDGFFHFLICCSNWYWGWQQTTWIRKTVMVFRCRKNFMCVIFTVTDNHENFLTVKISQYTVHQSLRKHPAGFPVQDDVHVCYFYYNPSDTFIPHQVTLRNAMDGCWGSSRCLNMQDLPVSFPVYIPGQDGNDRGKSGMLELLFEHRDVSKHQWHFKYFTPRWNDCNWGVRVATRSNKLSNLFPTSSSSYTGNLTGRTLRSWCKVDVVQHPGPQWTACSTPSACMATYGHQTVT